MAARVRTNWSSTLTILGFPFSPLPTTIRSTRGAEAIQRGIELGVEVWPGIEISCTTSEGECHILGLQVDHNYDPLLQELARWQARREERAAQMVSRLAQLGFCHRSGAGSVHSWKRCHWETSYCSCIG